MLTVIQVHVAILVAEKEVLPAAETSTEIVIVMKNQAAEDSSPHGRELKNRAVEMAIEMRSRVGEDLSPHGREVRNPAVEMVIEMRSRVAVDSSLDGREVKSRAVEMATVIESRLGHPEVDLEAVIRRALTRPTTGARVQDKLIFLYLPKSIYSVIISQ